VRIPENCDLLPRGCDPIAAANRCRHRVCAVQRRRFPVGKSPTRQVLQPEATGATVEVTKRLKPSGNACHDLR